MIRKRNVRSSGTSLSIAFAQKQLGDFLQVGVLEVDPEVVWANLTELRLVRARRSIPGTADGPQRRVLDVRRVHDVLHSRKKSHAVLLVVELSLQSLSVPFRVAFPSLPLSSPRARGVHYAQPVNRRFSS